MYHEIFLNLTALGTISILDIMNLMINGMTVAPSPGQTIMGLNLMVARSCVPSCMLVPMLGSGLITNAVW